VVPEDVGDRRTCLAVGGFIGQLVVPPERLARPRRPHEDVGEDRHRVALLHDGLDPREPPQELAFADGELH